MRSAKRTARQPTNNTHALPKHTKQKNMNVWKDKALLQRAGVTSLVGQRASTQELRINNLDVAQKESFVMRSTKHNGPHKGLASDHTTFCATHEICDGKNVVKTYDNIIVHPAPVNDAKLIELSFLAVFAANKRGLPSVT